jgi:hypothetical protein
MELVRALGSGPRARRGDDEADEEDYLRRRNQPVRPDRQLRRQHQVQQQRCEHGELSGPERIVPLELLGVAQASPRQVELVQAMATQVASLRPGTGQP